MREIKFRAWDKKMHCYHPQDAMDGLGGFYYCYGLNPIREDFELQQYTGLWDKNGKEIYEGDILALGVKGREVVRYEDGGFKVLNIYLGAGIKSNLPVSDVAIIGNIYENPEFLS